MIKIPSSIEAGKGVTLCSDTSEPIYITQNGVLLPEPLNLLPDVPFNFFPQAPGHYTFKANGCEAELEVTDGLSISGPVNVDGMWFSSQWSSVVERGREPETFAMLPELVQPGSIVYDIGANIGLYAREFLRLGAYVYCFEPNPAAMHYLSMNLAGLLNYQILPLAVSDKCGTVDLIVNPDNLLLGSMVPIKQGITIGVSGIALDDTIERYSLKPPNVIKMDIEGGEVLAIKGMLQTIGRYHPVLIFELHGYIPARETLKHLSDYSWRIPGRDGCYTPAELEGIFGDSCYQVVGVTEQPARECAGTQVTH